MLRFRLVNEDVVTIGHPVNVVSAAVENVRHEHSDIIDDPNIIGMGYP